MPSTESDLYSGRSHEEGSRTGSYDCLYAYFI